MLREEDIPAGVGACGDIPRERVFETVPHRIVGELPKARALEATSIALPVHPTLSEATVARWSQALRELALRAAA